MISETTFVESAAAEYIARRSRITSMVKNKLIDVLQLDLTEEQIGFDSPLFGAGLGLDSVDAVGLAAAIEQELGVPVLDSDIQVFRSINTIVDFVLARQALAADPDADPDAGAAAEAGEADAVLREKTPDDLGAAGPPPGAPEDEFRDYVAVRTGVALVDHSPAAKLRVRGEGAAALLDRVVAGNVLDLAMGGLLHSLVLRDDGSILALIWLGRDEAGYLVLAGQHQRAALAEALTAGLASFEAGAEIEAGAGIEAEIEDVTDDFALLSLLGPRAQDLLVDLFDEDLLRLGYGELTGRERDGMSLQVGRFGETGEFDFRLLVPVAAAAALQAEIAGAGAVHGLRLCSPAVLPGLMAEMKSIHQDAHLVPGCTPPEVDLQWMVQAGKDEDFVGRAAVLAGLGAVRRRLVVLALPAGLAEEAGSAAGGGDALPAGSEVRHEDAAVGFVQASSFSYVLGRRIALAYLDVEVAWPGLRFTVHPGGGRVVAATGRSAPLFLTRTVVESLNV
jgi:aminomethyltransferase